MNPVFTEYVRQLDPSGEPPDRESFARVWGELRLLLEQELRRRGLWNAPPSYLGIYGRTRWREEDAMPGSGPGIEDGLEELVAELYPYVFIDRLNKLVDHLRSKPTIDGLVVLNVRHLLHERQKKHDRLGYRVFEVFHQAVARAVAEEQLFILKGDARIRNDTVLGCRSGLDPDSVPPAPEEKVGEWNDVLLPELVTGKGKAREWVIASLRTFLGRLPGEGTEAFVFQELLEPLKKDVRVRWAAGLEFAQGEMGVAAEAGEGAGLVPLVPPDSEVEDRDSLEKLDECLAASIDRVESRRNRDELRILWRDLHRRAQEGEVPSQRKLAEELDFPRRRLSNLFSILGELLEDCRRTRVFGVTEVGPGRAEGGAMELNSRAEALRAQTGEARHRLAEVAEDQRRRSRQGPSCGDVFSVAETGDFPIEWVLLRKDGDGFHAVPADMSPLAGPGDVVVSKEAACGPLTLRCSFGLHLDAPELDPGMRTGSLPAEILEQARALSGSAPGAAEDPELDEWIREVVEPARMAVCRRQNRPNTSAFRSGGSSDRRPRASLRQRMVSDPWALAASILLLVSLGLGGGMLRQRKISASGNVPFQSLAFSVSRERADIEKLVLPGEAQEVLFILNIAELMGQRYERYRLLVQEQETKELIWRSERLTEMRVANLTVTLPVRLIPSGGYLFQLYGLDGLQETALAEHSLRIEYEP